MVRIGKVSYLNTLPLFYLWDTSKVSFIEGSPSELVSLLRKGKIHAGIVSSVEYLYHPENYRLVKGVSISSLKKACSVLIFSNQPIEKIKSIYLTPESLSSKVLAFYILRRVYGIQVEQIENRELAEAHMLIGDEAIKEKLSGRWTYVYDLGEKWFELHGLPFVFALFLVRKDAPEGLELFIQKQCERSKSEFFKDLKEGRLKIKGYGELFLREYFTSCLSYELDKKEEESLKILGEILSKNSLL